MLLLTIFIIFILIPFSFAVNNNETIELEANNDDIPISNEFHNDIHVDVNGDDNNEGNEDSPVATINKAINISSNNSKIFIHEGIYKENNLNITRPVEIYGMGSVIIDAENSSRIFTINTKPSDEVILNGITFVNGRAYQGGAIYVRNAITTIDNSKFVNNTALTEGGAIYWNSDYGTLMNTVIEGNTARDGAGVSWGGINSTFTGGDYGQVINCTFSNNHLVQDEDACIGLSIYSNRAKVINSSFVNHNVVYNSSFEVLYINGDYSTVSGCLFANNSMTMAGAAGFDGNYVEVYDNIFVNNTLSFNDSFGGAMGIQSETIDVYNNTFIGNGGDYCVGGAIFVNTVETFQFNFITIKDNVFINNIAFNGAGIYATSNSNFLTLLIENNTFDGGKSINGAGIFLRDIYDPVNIRNNSYKDLVAENGAGIYAFACTLDLSHNIMENCTSENGGEIYSYGDINSGLKLIFNNVSGTLSRDVTLTAILLDDSDNTISTNYISFYVDGAEVKGGKSLNSIKTSFNEVGVKEITGKFLKGEATVQPGFLTILNSLNLNTHNIVAYGKTAVIVMNLTDSYNNPVPNANVIINFNGNDLLLISNGEGIAKTSISMDYGVYTLTAQYIGDDNYQPTNSTFNVTVLSSIVSSDLTRAYNSGMDFSATLFNNDGSKLTNTEITLVVNGKEYKVVTDSNGVVKLNKKLSVGKYNVMLSNPATGDEISNNLVIVKRLTGNKNVNMYFGAGSYYKVRVYGDDGKPVGAGEVVKMTINGKTYNVKTDKNGYAKFKITLKAKKYTITAKYKGVKVSNKVVVKPVLTAKNISKKKAKTIKFQAKLVNTKGKALKNKKITFKVKGKTYKAKTNKKGIATISIKNLKVGKYTITTKYGKSTIKNTIKIKK